MLKFQWITGSSKFMKPTLTLGGESQKLFLVNTLFFLKIIFLNYRLINALPHLFLTLTQLLGKHTPSKLLFPLK